MWCVIFFPAIDVPTATTIDEILPTPQINDSAPSTVQQPHSSDSSSDEPTSAPTIASPSTSKTLSSSGRSSGVLAGIVLGFLIGMLVVPSAIITLLVVLFIFKRRKTKHRIAASNEVAAAAARMSGMRDAIFRYSKEMMASPLLLIKNKTFGLDLAKLVRIPD